MTVESKKTEMAAKSDSSSKACDMKNTCCGLPNCACKSKCKVVERVLCLVLKLVKITAFMGVTLVLFDVHGMFKSTSGMPASPVAMQQTQ